MKMETKVPRPVSNELSYNTSPPTKRTLFTSNYTDLLFIIFSMTSIVFHGNDFVL